MAQLYGPPSDGSIIPHELEDAIAADVANGSSPIGGSLRAAGLGAPDNSGLRSIASGAAHVEVNKSQIIGWGSSTIEGLGGSLGSVAARFGATYTSGAKGGEKGEHTLARMGARPARLNFPDAEIPASGAVTVTSPNLSPSANMLAFTGRVWGVEGTLSSTADTLTWTRTTAGDTVPAGDGAEFIPTVGVQHRNSFAILNIGKNDVTGALEDTDYIIRGQREAMAHLAGAGARFLVVGHFVNTNYAVGGWGQRQVLEANAAAARDAGEYFFDLQAYVTSSEIWDDTGITPTGTDLQQQADGLKPLSLSSDDFHLNSAALRAVADQIGQKLVDLGIYTERSLPTVADTFSRPDSTTLGTTEEGGKTWIVQGLSGSGTAVIESGTAGFANGGTSRHSATFDAGTADGVFSYDIIKQMESWTYIRMVDYGNTLTLSAVSGFWTLRRYVNGTSTVLQASTVAPADGQHFEVILAGESVIVNIDGVEAINTADTTNTNGTRFGMGGWQAGGSRWDNFEMVPAFDLQFTPGPARPLYLTGDDGTRYRVTVVNGALTAEPA